MAVSEVESRNLHSRVQLWRASAIQGRCCECTNSQSSYCIAAHARNEAQRNRYRHSVRRCLKARHGRVCAWRKLVPLHAAQADSY